MQLSIIDSNIEVSPCAADVLYHLGGLFGAVVLGLLAGLDGLELDCGSVSLRLQHHKTLAQSD